MPVEAMVAARRGAGSGRRPGTDRCAPGTVATARAIRLSLRAEPVAVRAALDRLRADLLGAGIAGEDVAVAELVLAEVLNNVVEHAFSDLDGGRIELTVAPGETGLSCEVRDNGRPMPGGAPPGGTPPAAGRPARDEMLEALPEGGFGWFLIRSLAREIAYARKDGGNLLGLRIPLGAGAEAGAAPRPLP